MKTEAKGSSGVLAMGGVAALLASSCCLGPLVLVMLGFSGAWIGSLSALEPYRPFFLALSVLALCLASLRIFRKPPEWGADNHCFTPKAKRFQMIFLGVIGLLALIGFTFPYIAPFLY